MLGWLACCLASISSDEDSKYTRRRKASAPKLPFRTRSLFDYASEKTGHRILGRTLTSVHRGPNIYTIDDFLTGSEVDHLLELIAQNKRRFGGSKTDQDDGVGLHATEYRTSRTSAYGACTSQLAVAAPRDLSLTPWHAPTAQCM